ncbi:UDP:flavonoid glycosyltransferase YjiC (YdhE family) [Kitasatospora sp. GP82]|nr:UDP:flavonoid glycosyltransferase YjiC (YdhE family) [Kitasatospora sp. GP82]
MGPQAVPLRELTAERLASALRQAVDEPRYRRRAREVATRINAEDGAGTVRDFLERTLAAR